MLALFKFDYLSPSATSLFTFVYWYIHPFPPIIAVYFVDLRPKCCQPAGFSNPLVCFSVLLLLLLLPSTPPPCTLRYEQWDMRCACVVKIPSNLHVCFLNRACSLIPARLLCKSTADATRERRHKTNRHSQRCTHLCSTTFLPVSGTSFVFSSVTAHQQRRRRRRQPHVLSFAPYIHLSPVFFLLFLLLFHFIPPHRPLPIPTRDRGRN